MFELYSLISGSSGNAALVTNGSESLLVDCGTSGKRLLELVEKAGAAPDTIKAILVTHEHTDHTKGVGIIARKLKIPVYATAGTHGAMNVGNLADDARVIISPEQDFEIGHIGVLPFSIPHDAAQPCGYSFVFENKKLTVATDIGHLTGELMDSIKGSDSVILESNHDIDMLRFGEYPYPLKQRILGDNGHLSNETAADAALELAQSGTRHIMLGHLSDKNNLPEIALLESSTRLTDGGAKLGCDVTLQVAGRYNITKFEEIAAE